MVGMSSSTSMPNLRLSKTEVDALIKFMQEEDDIAAAAKKDSSQKTAGVGNKPNSVSLPRRIDGRFELADATGRTVTNKDFLGKWMVVFFGYTFCPDVCPTTLNNIAVALNQLGPQAKDVQPIFISVDPKRDNPASLAEYTAAFDTRILGLTGNSDQIAAAARS